MTMRLDLLQLLGLCIFIALFATLEARGRKDAWRHKKLKHLAKFSKLKEDGVGVVDLPMKKGLHGRPPMPPGEGFHPRKFGQKMKDRHFKKKHGDKKHHKKMSWLKIKTENTCNMGCEEGEVCISGPIDKRPICVDKKDLKKSVKLFHRYHKKEMKSWRKFQKKNYKKDSKWLRKQEKVERKNRNIIALKRHYLKKHGYEDFLKKGALGKDMKKEEFEEHVKKFNHEKSMKKLSHDFKDSMKELDFKYPMTEEDLKKSLKEDDFKNSMKEDGAKNSLKEDYPKESVEEGGYTDSLKKLDSKDGIKEKEFDLTKERENEKMGSMSAHIAIAPSETTDKGECTHNEFVQMRTRMMGWFHLLHGQDRLARKAHGGGIGKFYKHVSVKKELREHDGVKCGCLKSAMWEFNQLDKNEDDHLSPDELAMLEENSLEPCMKPYLDSCDKSGDGKLSSDEWCCCFSHVLAPCIMKIDEIKKSKDKEAFIPRCDREGYYMREQCRSDAKDKLYCWCVDINGNELKGTATNGRAHCSKLAKLNIMNMKEPFF